jgi:hypothetical protein
MIKLINLLKETQNSYVYLHAGYTKNSDYMVELDWKPEFKNGVMASNGKGANDSLHNSNPNISVSGFNWYKADKDPDQQWADIYFKKRISEVYLELNERSQDEAKIFGLDITQDEYDNLFPCCPSKIPDITLQDLVPYGYNPVKAYSDGSWSNPHTYYSCYVWDIKKSEIIKIEEGVGEETTISYK